MSTIIQALAQPPAASATKMAAKRSFPASPSAYEDGAFLQRLVKRHGAVKIHITSTDAMRTDDLLERHRRSAWPQKPDQIVMLGCHYDGHDISQGAVDPASGTVAVLEAARVLAQYAGKLPHTIRFSLWGVEEIGLIGSTQYVESMRMNWTNIRFYLNMDMAGAMSNNGIVLNQWPDLATICSRIGRRKWRCLLAWNNRSMPIPTIIPF